ncbi:FixH family protein [Hyphomonadaceae bacterium BL14]|nr:FixH family protein [Hyphomonadaceae bacterium BL14]
MTRSEDTPTRRREFRLTGWHVLAILLAFFGVVFSVNGFFITSALTTFTGEEATRAYVRGLEYNAVLDARRAQAELGWSAAVNVADGRVLVSVTDPDGAPVGGLDLSGELRRPGDPLLDRPLTFSEIRAGVYAAQSEDMVIGRWLVRVRAAGDDPFELERDVWLQ